MSFKNPLENDFFGVCIPLAYYFCILPDILENRSKTFKLCYSIYTKLVYLLAIFCHGSQLVKLFQIITDENFIFDELIRNYTITAYHFTALVKCVFLRGKLSGMIFKNIMAHEKELYQNSNEEVISVYRSTLKSVKNTKNYYMAGIVVVVVFYIAAPALREPYYIIKNNETIIVPQVPLSSWTMVDDNYWYAFVWTSTAGAYLSVFFLTTDLICYSFIMFGTCQLEILEHHVSNFFTYADKLRQDYGYDEVNSYRLLQREYIVMHQGIISYITSLNSGLKHIMMLDFLPGSFQLAGMIFQMMTNLSVVQCVLLGQFICTLIARIYIYCNSAHNLAIQSQKIAIAWYEIDWMELPIGVRRNMMFCIARSQKSLNITIWDYQNMSMITFLAILKGTYSFMMLLMTV